ncbi:DUF2281 domain-containing protein [Romeriopsis navalis]|uniref:DUF2281 domain-containing protein n=1 Tax=Romeriopsis navalis TaxID=2992132 RepID=UPI0021F8DCB9|nr:DUF2281 domain-containing protein [Romeriopsis navalis]
MTIAEQIYTLVKTLPEAQAREILTFLESLCEQNQSDSSFLPWPKLVKSLAGDWSGDLTNLDEIRTNLWARYPA